MTPAPAIAVYALTQAGAQNARRLAAGLGGEARLFLPARLAQAGETGFGRIAEAMAANWRDHAGHVCFAASGIVVRAIAPLIEAKAVDPAVVVCDPAGRFAVSLIAGHLGGANALALRVAALCGAQPVITTATDCAGAPALELLARDAGLTLGNPGRLKHVNAALAEGRSVPLWDPEDWLRLAPLPLVPEEGRFFHAAPTPDAALVRVQWQRGPSDAPLLLHPPCLCLGLGCRKGVPQEEILACVAAFLEQCAAAPQSLLGLASAALKAQEPGLLAAARQLGLPLRCYDATELASVPVPNPSPRVAQTVGAPSVAEAAALLLSGNTALLAEKERLGRVTLALAQRIRP